MTEQKELEELEEGDKILFNDRKQPLEVSKLEEDRVLVKGPGGGEYEIYEDDGTLLWSKEGNRRYSSYCNDLRTVGSWERENDKWEHSSGTTIKLEKNEIGYWTIKAEGIEIEDELDLPKYGYSDKEKVEKDVEKVVRKHPEG
ncbi:MAG: hypothetical protein ACI9LV_000977 [Candidatus Nanohaloarchaea archaeon]|jgi:hypothetical protein